MKKEIKDFVRKKLGYDGLDQKLYRNKRIADEILWAQIFNNTITDSSWFKVKSVSPGRWALGYPALYITYRILNDIKPGSILEFGLGESSKLTFQYVKAYADKSLKIIEQDEDWLDYFSREKFEISPYTTLLSVKKESYKGNEIYEYSDLISSINDKKYDFVLIDGPWGSKHYSRHQIVDIVEADLLEENFVILMDDFDRQGEKETMQEVQSILEKRKIKYVSGVYSGAKDTFILCSSYYRFLVSL